MRNAMHWINQRWWAYGALVVVVDAALLLAFNPRRSPLGAVAAAVFYTALSVGMRARRLRKDRRATGDDHADVVSLGRMLRKGRVPDSEPQREQMRGLIRRRARQLHRLRWLWPLFNVMGLGLGILDLATGGTRAGAVLVAVMIGLDIMALIGWRRQNRHMRTVGRAVGAF